MSNKKVDYNNIAKNFSHSRKGMKWEEIDYFLENYFKINQSNISILDVWCGSARLLEHISSCLDISTLDYTWVDLSSSMLKEAKKAYPDKTFIEIDMMDLDKLDKKNNFDFIFFIASFHHLDSLESREEVLNKAKNLLKPGGIIFMTNWSLQSDLNNKKYKESLIEDSENIYWWKDYNIVFWDYKRFYHCFSLDELQYLFEKTWFEIIESREFENKKNFVSILKRQEN